MNIFLVTGENSSSGGGLAYSCLSFERMLRGLGYEVTVIQSTPAEDIVTAGYDPNLGYALAMEEKLKTDCQKLQAGDLIISFGGGMTAYYSALMCSKSLCRLWVLFRGSDANIAKWDGKKIFYNQYALSVAEKIFCLSEEIAANIRLLKPCPNNIYVIPNYCERINPNIIPLPKDNIVMGCGATHLNEKKGIIRILRMMSVFRRIHPEIAMTLELAGSIDHDVLELYEDIVKEANLVDVVRFLGPMSRSEFKNTQANWNLYIQGSICEGMGNSVTDAMSNGIPVIITNTGLDTVNLMVMGWSSNVSLLKTETLYTIFKKTGIGKSWNEAILSGLIVILVAALVFAFLGTRLGLMIRASGDNIDMVRASSINPAFTITVGLAVANSLTALSGALVGQYQSTTDINSGTGIVVVALACLIIGETCLGKKTILKGVIAAILGSLIYRTIYAIILYTKVIPVQGLKLMTAVVVALAIFAPTFKDWLTFQKQKKNAGKRGQKNA